jgi:hypothetical protein
VRTSIPFHFPSPEGRERPGCIAAVLLAILVIMVIVVEQTANREG